VVILYDKRISFVQSKHKVVEIYKTWLSSFSRLSGPIIYITAGGKGKVVSRETSGQLQGRRRKREGSANHGRFYHYFFPERRGTFSQHLNEHIKDESSPCVCIRM